jgi:hypothetical protein
VALSGYASLHLVRKREAGKVTTQTLAASQKHLERAVTYFGADRALDTIDVEDVAGWIAALRETRSRGRAFSSSTIRHHLNSLSNLFRRAGAEKKVPLGYNPVVALPRSRPMRGGSAGSKYLRRRCFRGRAHLSRDVPGSPCRSPGSWRPGSSPGPAE